MRSAARVSTACSQSARFQKEEAVADAFEKVGLVLDEPDGLVRRPETGETFGDAFTDFCADASRATAISLGDRAATVCPSGSA